MKQKPLKPDATSKNVSSTVSSWLQRKFRHWYPEPAPGVAAQVRREALTGRGSCPQPQFVNPFGIADLGVFDDDALGTMLARGALGLPPEVLGRALRGASAEVAERVGQALPEEMRATYAEALASPARSGQVRAAQRRVLDAFFWELVYWKRPEDYDALTKGERLHPGIFARLASEIRGRTVLDAGAGAGRATFAALDAGAARVVAVEPSPGLRRLLARKVAERDESRRVDARRGTFDALPLPDASVDVALSCSAFTADPTEGGESGLAELRRVTRPGGLIAILWPRPQDYAWFASRGFCYAALPVPHDFGVEFRTSQQALRVACLFYARTPAVLRYLRATGGCELPYRVLGVNPPHDFCWLRVPTAA